MHGIEELFDIDRIPTALAGLLQVAAPWDVLARLDAFGEGIGAEVRGDVHPTAVLEGRVFVAEGAKVGPFAYLRGPVYLAEGAEVGHAAYLRGPVVLGPAAHVLHASEVKRSLLLGGAKAPHFNYIGDSVIGHDVNLGAGTKVANLKAHGTDVKVEGRSTGLRKFGSALGDGVSVGCNVVFAPGTIVGPGTVIYAGAVVRGSVGANRILKMRPSLEDVERAIG